MSRYFVRPLLDLTDVGAYVIGLRAEVALTPQLGLLGLHAAAGVTAPAEAQSLMDLAAAGQLSTLAGELTVAVHLSVKGQSRLGIASAIAVTSQVGRPEHKRGFTMRIGCWISRSIRRRA